MAYSNISGNCRLGHTWVSGQQPGALGEEFTIVAGEYDPSDDVFVNSNAGAVRVKLLHNSSGGTLSPGCIVKRDTSNNMSYDVLLAASTNPACAIVDPTLQAAVPIDGIFLGIIYGETDIRVGASNLSKGNTISSANSGVAVVNDLSTVALIVAAFGVMLEAGTATTLAKAFVDFRALK
jgi:hypothetical protein